MFFPLHLQNNNNNDNNKTLIEIDKSTLIYFSRLYVFANFLFLHAPVNAWRGRDATSGTSGGGGGKNKGCRRRRGRGERAADIVDDDARGGLDERSNSTSTTDLRHRHRHHLFTLSLRRGRRRRGRRRGSLRGTGARAALGRPEQHVSVRNSRSPFFDEIIPFFLSFLSTPHLTTTKQKSTQSPPPPRRAAGALRPYRRLGEGPQGRGPGARDCRQVPLGGRGGFDGNLPEGERAQEAARGRRRRRSGKRRKVVATAAPSSAELKKRNAFANSV